MARYLLAYHRVSVRKANPLGTKDSFCSCLVHASRIAPDRPHSRVSGFWGRGSGRTRDRDPERLAHILHERSEWKCGMVLATCALRVLLTFAECDRYPELLQMQSRFCDLPALLSPQSRSMLSLSPGRTREPLNGEREPVRCIAALSHVARMVSGPSSG